MMDNIIKRLIGENTTCDFKEFLERKQFKSWLKSKHPIKYTIKKGCISFQVKQPSMVVSPSFFIPFFPFVWQHL